MILWLLLLADQTTVTLQAAPRVSEAPARIVFNAILAGGEDSEELYCPDVEWIWGDGTHSLQEGSCPPYKAGETAVQREFTMAHLYGKATRPRVTVVLRKGKRTLGQAQAKVIVARKGASLDAIKWREH